MRPARRRQLARDALARALRVRREAGIPLDAPLCVYDLAMNMGVDVWFKDYPSMEGMYCKDPGPLMVVSSLRPAGRQAYTAGHELGHHVYGHGRDGYCVDELVQGERQSDTEEEFLADCFSGFLLMPKAAVLRGFEARRCSPEAATTEQVYAVAGWLGVGLDTLLTHMEASLAILGGARAAALRKVSPKRIKSQLLGSPCTEELIVVDETWADRAIDIQVGDWVVATRGVDAEHPGVMVVQTSLLGTVLRGTKPGLGRIMNTQTGWSSFVRVCRRGYTGRGRFRHTPEEAEDALSS